MKNSLKVFAVISILAGITLSYFLIYQKSEFSAPNSKDNKKIKTEVPEKYQTQLQYLESSLDSLHQIKGVPVLGDWLYSNKEKGQTFEQYFHNKPPEFTENRKKLYIQPLGSFNETEQKILKLTAEYLSIFYKVPTEILDSLPLSLIPKTERRDLGEGEQINVSYVLSDVLKPRLPDDAVSYLAFTTDDIYKGDFNFLFGLGSTKKRVGVYSINRFGNPQENHAEFQQVLKRTLKLASHELGHMFGIKHCTKYECVMNGSNSLYELDAKPYHLCPVDLLKISWNLDINEIERYEKLLYFWEDNGFPVEADFYKKSIMLLEKNSYMMQ